MPSFHQHRRQSAITILLINKLFAGTSPFQNSTLNAHISTQAQEQERRNLLLKDNNSTNKSTGLDFIIAAFPQTSTSAISEYLDTHDEIEILEKYVTDSVTDSQGGKRKVEYTLQNEKEREGLYQQLTELEAASKNDITTNNNKIKRGVKWPTAINHEHLFSISYLRDRNPRDKKLKIIIGLRNPIRWFESFYNYIVRTSKMGLDHGDIPSPYSLIGNRDNEWRSLYTEMARFELNILQLGKVDITPEEMKWMAETSQFVVQTDGIKTFFYLQEQVGDESVRPVLLEDMRNFLELSTPFPTVMENKKQSHSIGDFDICDPAYDALRKILLENAQKTANWILNRLAYGMDVTFGSREDFMRIVQTWHDDPCVTATSG